MDFVLKTDEICINREGGGEKAGSPLPYLLRFRGIYTSLNPSSHHCFRGAFYDVQIGRSRYLGFSWSSDGLAWPAEHGELVSVEPTDGSKIWTDLVRTPTSLIAEDDGTYTIFYAARDTHNASSRTGSATQPYTNCSVPPTRVNRHVGYAEKAAAAMTEGSGSGGGSDGPPPRPPEGWSDGCFWGMGMLRVKLNFDGAAGSL